MPQIVPHFTFFLSGSSYPWQEEIKTARDFQTRNGILEKRNFEIRSLYEYCQESGNMKTQTLFALFPPSSQPNITPTPELIYTLLYFILEERLAMAFRSFLSKYEKSFCLTAESCMDSFFYQPRCKMTVCCLNAK